MSIGRDIYCDTRIILQTLEERFPKATLGATEPDQKAVEVLLEKWTIDGGIFNRAAQLIPTEAPMLKDPKFTKDREDLSGRSWKKADMERLRPEALAAIRDAFDFLEAGLLADGRDWILKTQKPSLADIECRNSAAETLCLRADFIRSHLALPLDNGNERRSPTVLIFIRQVSQGLFLGRSL